MHYQLKTCFTSLLSDIHDTNLLNEAIKVVCEVIDKF